MSKDIRTYFSFIHTSDLIILLFKIFHVHSSCTSNMKNIKRQYLTKAIVSSKYIVDAESIKSNDNNITN